MKKREFIKKMGLSGLSPLLTKNEVNSSIENKLPSLPVEEDKIWELVRSQYKLHPDFINLESGYYNIIPIPTMDKHIEHIKRVNLEGSFYMRNNRFEDKTSITKELSQQFGCSASSLVITRNTTESLDLVIGGYPWQKGDHAIHAVQDYGAMQDMFSQIEKRHAVEVSKSISTEPS